MKILDKLKNALFEEEYVEVEEKPKKKKFPKENKKDKYEEEKPIAKKIVLPEREEVKVTNHNDLEEEIMEETVEEPKKERTFPIISDSEFMTDDVNDLEGFRENKQEEIVREEPKKEVREEFFEEPVKIYDRPEKKHIEEKHTKLYGMDQIPIPEPEYGTYEKDDRTYFKPSPIISPIYGILDKNYKKDDIAPKREVRITSSFSRENLDVDEVRRKAYGTLSTDIEDELEPLEDDSNLMDQDLVDLSDDETPEIKKVTIEDAEEYFNDLGLEYNVDYKDTQKENAKTKSVEEESVDNTEEYAPVVDKEEYEARLREQETETEVEDTDVEDDNIDEDDNLFDLIDSMYEKE